MIGWFLAGKNVHVICLEDWKNGLNFVATLKGLVEKLYMNA